MSGKIDCSHLFSQQGLDSTEVLMSKTLFSAGGQGEVRILNNPLTVTEYSRISYQMGTTIFSPASAWSEISRFCFLHQGESTQVSHCVSPHTFNAVRPERDSVTQLDDWPLRKQRALSMKVHPALCLPHHPSSCSPPDWVIATPKTLSTEEIQVG